MMSSVDQVYIYGQENNGSLNPDEWVKFTKENIIHNDILDNIDDCYID